MTSIKLLPNFLITTHDINIANSMFGTDIGGVRGETVINKPRSLDIEKYLMIT